MPFVCIHLGAGDDVTSPLRGELELRLSAEERARQSEVLLEHASALGHLGAWAIDLDFRVTWSKETLAILGYRQQDQPRLEDGVALLDVTRRPELEWALGACMRHGTPFDIECKARTVDGRRVWLRLIGGAQKAADGQIVGTVGAVQDVTAKRQAADALQELSDRLSTTLESITDAFLTVDRDWRFTYINGEAEKMAGRSRNGLIGKMLWREFSTFAGSVFQTQLERAVAESTTVKFEAWCEEFGCHLQVTAYPSAQGLALCLRDVTESHALREALVESEERYRMLFQTSPDAIFESLPDGTVNSANAAACALFGRSEADLRRGGRAAVIAPDDVRLGPMLEQRDRTGKATGQLTMVRGDGSRFEAEVTSAQYKLQGSVYTSQFIRDISQRLEHEKEILKLNKELTERVWQRTIQLEAANAELRSFAHSLAHDLRAPIAAIEAFSGALEESLTLVGSDRDRHYVRRVRAAAQRMHDYVEALLSMAQVSQAQLVAADVDLSAMAMGILSDLSTREPDRRVDTHVQAGMRAHGDRRLLRMALENLLGNAWKFTCRRPCAEISFTAARQADGEPVYCVRDNGVGFDMQYGEKLFCTFQRLHSESEFPGTGVGLANVARIVGRHGGRVWAEATEEVGAAFYFTLRLMAS